jgi:hypothetical protein
MIKSQQLCRVLAVAIFCALVSNASMAALWERVSGESYKILWKSLTFTELKIDPRQSMPAGGDILDPQYSKNIVIHYHLGVAAEHFRRLTLESLNSAYTEEELAAAKADIERFCSWYEDVNRGDSYSLSWRRDEGLLLSLNTRQLGNIIDPDAAALILSVWLGEAAVSGKQRDAILASWREGVGST